MEIDNAAGRISIVKTSLGYTKAIGPSPSANTAMNISINISAAIAKMIILFIETFREKTAHT